MNSSTNVNPDIGKQTGSLRPLHKVHALVGTLSVLALLFPVTGFAANMNYLEQNAPAFIDKTQAQYGEMVNIAALLHDYDEKLILAVIIVESEGNEVATSHRGAQGLMQLMPGTAKAMGAKDPKEPFQNILAGTKYLRALEDDYGFDSPQEALVAYNMGPSRAKRWLSQYSALDYGYVQKVMYVYGVVDQEAKAKKDLAASIEAKMSEQAKLSQQASPMLTKPRTLSLAAFPMTLPSGRKSQIQQEN